MIHYVAGDILLSGAQAIAHGVAPKDPMTQGLARALHEKFPAMHRTTTTGATRRIPSRAPPGCGAGPRACAW